MKKKEIFLVCHKLMQLCHPVYLQYSPCGADSVENPSFGFFFLFPIINIMCLCFDNISIRPLYQQLVNGISILKNWSTFAVNARHTLVNPRHSSCHVIVTRWFLLLACDIFSPNKSRSAIHLVFLLYLCLPSVCHVQKPFSTVFFKPGYK